MNLVFRYLLVISALLVYKPSKADRSAPLSDFFFEQLDNSKGLSNSAINTIYQDNDNLLWVGTWDGLNMFDGSGFKVFNYTSKHQNNGSIGNNVILDVSEGEPGNVWINTVGGITRLDKNAGKLYQYFYNASSKGSISEREFILATDTNGTVLCFSSSLGLNRFDPQSNSFIKLFLPETLGRILKIDIAPDGLIWLLTDKGTISVCRSSGASLRVLKVFNHPKGISNFFVAGSGVLMESPAGLYLAEGSNQLRRLPYTPGGIKAITEYNSHYVVVSNDFGVRVYDRNFKSSSFMRTEIERLKGIKVTYAFKSKDGILWLGTDGSGLIRFIPGKNYFNSISRHTGYSIDKPIRAFCNVEGDLWAGSKGQGVFQFRNFLKEGTSMMSKVLDTKAGLNDNSVFALRADEDYVYIGTDGMGLTIYDLRKQKIFKWLEIKGTKDLPAFRSVYAIHTDADGSLWLGTSGSGLIHLRLGMDTEGLPRVYAFRQYLSHTTPGLANDIIYALAHTDDHTLWIACRYSGLSALDKRSGTFRTFKAFSYPESLSNNDVLSLFRDSKKGLWIGTSFGLNYLSYKESFGQNPSFQKFTMDDGLPNNTIHAIEQSEDGDIWMSTNKGLASLKPETKIIRTYTEEDGLQSNEFSDGAVWKSPAGHLFFGGIYGFNYFKPEDITGKWGQSDILITHCEVGGRSLGENRLLVLKSGSEKTLRYTTAREMNFFRINLRSVNFINRVNEFSYQLKGIDNHWYNASSGGDITYNNLPPGKYTLLVRRPAANGTWTDPLPVMELEVEQYLWLSYPALLTYLLLLISGGYLFHLYRKNKLEMKYKLAMEHELRRKDEVVHQQQLDFFTNIAHEIQTPLTLIMGSTEHYLLSGKTRQPDDTKSKYFLNLVHQHAVRLTYLVQQLLEFRKAEAGFVKKRNDYVDISYLLNNLSSLFLAESARLKKRYLRDIEEGIAGFTDKDKLEKILFNLLSNAFKHSGENETVEFRAEYFSERELLRITVSNTGCMLKENEIPRLFDKFYIKEGDRVQKLSNGIGLAFAQELAALLGSKIEATLTDGLITFSISLPLQCTAAAVASDNEIIPSTASDLHKSLLVYYEEPYKPDSEDGNKKSLINELHDGSRKRILIAEDEPQLRFLLQQVLQEQYIVYEASNGIEALSLIKSNKPDLIISDVMMPDMDGLELCRRVKSTPALTQIPFVILSARGSDDDKLEGYELGADAYIPKPFQVAYLMLRVRKLIDSRERMLDLIKDHHISSQFINTDIADADKTFLESLLKVIESRLDDPDLNAAILEDELALSKMQLYRKLKALAGMTPAEFIKRIRLKHAADMLRASQYTVSEIIYRTGFNSKSYFFREFKKIYESAPNDYRSQYYQPSEERL